MKNKFCCLVLAVCSLIACNEQPQKHEQCNDVYSTPRDSMLVKCKDLKGVGQIKIGDTAREVGRYLLFTDYDNDFSSDGRWKVSDYSLLKVIQENKHIRRIHNYTYKIGSLELEDVVLAFYDNVLVAISFEVSGMQNEKILNHYISKYGNGDGFKTIDNYYYEHRSKDVTFEEVSHIWYNERVKLEYSYRDYWNVQDECLESEKENYLITDNTGKYDLFLQEIEKSEEKFKSGGYIQESLDLL